MAIPQRDRDVFTELYKLYTKYEPLRLVTGEDFGALADDITVFVAKCHYHPLSKHLGDAVYEYFSERYKRERVE